jgi:lysophospholipase L1-like esterase
MRWENTNGVNWNPQIGKVTITISGTTTLTTIPRTNWAVWYVDSQETIAGYAVAANTFDGDPNTAWHTQYSNGSPPLPHEIQIDLGAVYDVSGFRYLPRQDGLPIGRISQFEFYVSQNGTSWGAPVATGIFVNNALEQQVLFPPKTGKYIRLRALTEPYDLPWTAVAELNALQTNPVSNQAPTAVINTPAAPVTVIQGSEVDFSGSGTDPDNNLPLSYSWSFGAGSGNADSALKDAGLVRFNIPGTYSVTFTVADAYGRAAQTAQTVTVLGAGSPLPTTGWTLRYVDSQAIGSLATNAFDGNANTYWKSQVVPSAPPPPHEIQIDLGASYYLGGFRYLPRQDGTTSDGRIYGYSFYVSADGVTWGSPVAAGAFADDASEKEASFIPVRGRYVRLQATTATSDEPWTSVAELRVLQAQTVTPSVGLIQPKSFYLQTSSNLFASAEASLSNGQGVRLAIDGGSANGGAQLDIYAAPYQATFSGINMSPHTIDAYVISSAGAIVGGAATHDQAIQVGIGDYDVAVGDSITYGYGDTISSDDISQDGRNSGGGFEPILADLLKGVIGRPHIVVNEGIPGYTSIAGVDRVPLLLQRHPYAARFIVMYGTNDAEPSGLGLHRGDSAYLGSYKDNMQRIVDEIRSAGKVAVLAKVPVVIPLNGQGDLRMQDYNRVIDELKADPANNMNITPPDFHAYFSTHSASEYFDSLHPNGIGYQSMAQLWFQSLRP